jgi:hypothetical protein
MIQQPYRTENCETLERAQFMFKLTGDLAKMAREDGQHMLAYIYDMARLELHKDLEKSRRVQDDRQDEEGAWRNFG